MESRTDIYQFDKQVKALGAYLDKSGIPERNKEIIRKFHTFCEIQGFSKPRILKYYPLLVYYSKVLGKDFDVVNR